MCLSDDVDNDAYDDNAIGGDDVNDDADIEQDDDHDDDHDDTNGSEEV